MVSFAYKMAQLPPSITICGSFPFVHPLIYSVTRSFLGDLSTHLKHLEQCVHVEPPDAEEQAKYSGYDDEHQEQSEPHGEGDAQQHAQQVIKRRHKQTHRWFKTWFKNLGSVKK